MPVQILPVETHLPQTPQIPTEPGAYLIDGPNIAPERVEVLRYTEDGALWVYSSSHSIFPLALFASRMGITSWARLEERIHELKVWPQYFRPIVEGVKRFELRRNDRPGGYQVGDVLHLFEFWPCPHCEGTGTERAAPGSLATPPECRTCHGAKGGYTGRMVRSHVGYVLERPMFGLEPGYVILSLTQPLLFPGDKWRPQNSLNAEG